MLLPQKIHHSWENFLTDEIQRELEIIESKLVEPFNPIHHDVTLRFLEVDLNQVKVIWLGQDVYPAPGAATGRAFETNKIQSWTEPFQQVSLKNIVRLIHKTYMNITAYENIYSYAQIKKAIENGEFPIASYGMWFDQLEAQGVLFLNTTFTCEANKPNSHKKIWAHFSEVLLQYISKSHPDIHWFLWGNEAQSHLNHITTGHYHLSRHPMMCSNKYEDDFLKATCFGKTWHLIHWLG
ncbi:MAG: uracil-DNA glycosylase [Clostridia bacterium]|nr:uracil-DNA glycosylase [Clostridia bacterium]